MRKKNNRGKRIMPGSNYVINDNIRAREVRVVEGLPVGIYSKRDAIIEAKKNDLDLVLISPKANPPVCKVVDFKKFLFEEKKKKKEQIKKQIKITVKEVQFSPNIGEHDYETKKKNVIKFLKKGNKVKANVFFKGRTIIHKDKGELVLAKLATEVGEYGTPEAMPKMIGKRMLFIIKPKNNKQ